MSEILKHEPTTIYIKPSTGLTALNLRDLWVYRELVFFMIYRDVNYALPFLTQIWFFITPVAYSAKVVSENWRWVYSLNPMAGVVNGFRWALLGAGSGPDAALWLSAGISLLIP